MSISALAVGTIIFAVAWICLGKIPDRSLRITLQIGAGVLFILWLASRTGLLR